MGDLDDGLAGRLVVADAQQAGLGQRLDDGVHLLGLRRPGDQFVDAGATARVLGALSGLGQAQQQAPGDAPAVRVQAGVDGVRALGQRALHAARRRVGLEREHPPAPPVPELEEQVLEQRQRARAVGHVAQDAPRQARLELQSGEARGLLHGAAQALRVQRAQQDLLRRDERAELGVLGAALVEVRAQGQEQHHAAGRDRGGVAQVAQERGPLGIVVAEREHLLELVHQQHEPRRRRVPGQQPAGRPVERLLARHELVRARAGSRRAPVPGRPGPRAAGRRARRSRRPRPRCPAAPPGAGRGPRRPAAASSCRRPRGRARPGTGRPRSRSTALTVSSSRPKNSSDWSSPKGSRPR